LRLGKWANQKLSVDARTKDKAVEREDNPSPDGRQIVPLGDYSNFMASISFLIRLLSLINPRPLGGVRVVWLCLENVLEIAVAEGRESGERPRPMAVNSPIQAISLLTYLGMSPILLVLSCIDFPITAIVQFPFFQES